MYNNVIVAIVNIKLGAHNLYEHVWSSRIAGMAFWMAVIKYSTIR